MLTLKMGPQLIQEGHMPMSAPPMRARNLSGGSTGSLPNGDIFQFPMISHFTEMPSTASTVPGGQHAKLERTVSEPNPAHRMQQPTSATSQAKNVLNPSRYKTEICRPFSESGFCKYGDKCQFAHGSQDLRGLPRHPKYKTELCRTFHTVGFCPYGPRCHFIHSEDESKLVEINAMKQQQAAQQAAREMAQLQAQQQALEFQLKALVSQVQLTNHMVSTPALCQMGGGSDRPRLQHSISVHPRLPDLLGSTGDSPAESSCSSGSPVLSPVFTEDSISEANSDSFSCLLTPPVSADSSFSFPGGEASNNSPLTMSPTRGGAVVANLEKGGQRTVSLSSSSASNGLETNGIPVSSAISANLVNSLQGLNLSQGSVESSDSGSSSSQAISSPGGFSPSNSPDQPMQPCPPSLQEQQNTSDAALRARLPIFARLAQNS